MTVRPLRLELHRYQFLRQKLLDAFPRIDDETLHDTLEGLSTLDALIAEIVRSALIDEALQTGLRERLEDMKARLSRFELRGAKKRELALEAMSEAGLKKLEQADFTVSVRAGTPPLVVADEHEIPQDYWIAQAPRLARQALLQALKQGTEIPGAVLGNPKPNLTVRTK
jgi:hypothetical protein